MKINTKYEYVNQNKREETNAHKRFTNRNAPLTFIRQRQRSTIVALRCVAYCGSKPKNVKTYLSWPSCAPPTPHTMSSSTRRSDTNNNPLNRELDTICPPKMKYHTRDSAPCTLYTTYSRYSRRNLHQS